VSNGGGHSPCSSSYDDDDDCQSQGNQSMLTYKTNYMREAAVAQNDDDDHDDLGQQTQQSTPFSIHQTAHNIAKIRRLRNGEQQQKQQQYQSHLKKSNTVNFGLLLNQIDATAASDNEEDMIVDDDAMKLNEKLNHNIQLLRDLQDRKKVSGAKCRRSNTTYTVRNSKIVEYFQNMPLKKLPLKKKKQKLSIESISSSTNSVDEMEKLHDDFFEDSTTNNTVEDDINAVGGGGLKLSDQELLSYLETLSYSNHSAHVSPSRLSINDAEEIQSNYDLEEEPHFNSCTGSEFSSSPSSSCSEDEGLQRDLKHDNSNNNNKKRKSLMSYYTTKSYNQFQSPLNHQNQNSIACKTGSYIKKAQKIPTQTKLNAEMLNSNQPQVRTSLTNGQDLSFERVRRSISMPKLAHQSLVSVFFNYTSFLDGL
jgi:hypothetical protein